jgi:ABC-2 type transport system permease protein
MKQFLAFLKKEFLHIIRDKRTLFILFGMPIAQVILFGFAITNEVNQAKITILDKSKDKETRAIIDKMLSSGYFEVTQMIESGWQLEEVFQKGKIKAAVVFEPDFGGKLNDNHHAVVQIIADATDPNIASTLVNYISNIILSYQQSINRGQQLPLQIVPEVRMIYNPVLDSTFYFVPGVIAVILMLVSAMMTSITIAREKELGNMEILLVSPLRPITIILGKSLPYVALALINAITILIIGFFVFGMPILGSMPLLMLELLLFICTSLALGIFISSVVETQQVALLISLMALMLPTILLSGFIFPLESMPSILQIISHAVPARWFIVIVKGIMLKGAGLETLWDETLILLGMTALLVLLSIKKFKIRLA